MDNAVVCGGEGVVGRATRLSLGIKHYYDLRGSNVTFDQLSDFRYIFLCLPTPTIKGKCDTSAIEETIKKIAEKGKNNIFIIRSTVIPGTCQRIQEELKSGTVVSNPEFLTEETWMQDSKFPEVIVIGCDDINIRQELWGVYRGNMFAGVEFVLTETKTAETIKYAINSFYALKVVFANEVYDFCTKESVNYETLKKTMYARKWVGANHLDVWHKGGRGGGGKCLPKDLDAFAHFTQSKLLLLADKINKKLLKEFPKKP